MGGKGFWMKRPFLALLFLFVLWCPSSAQTDIVSEVVLDRNPRTPSEFLEVLENAGLSVKTHMVANRGALNPTKGSFSIFGDVGPELTFGIFVEPDASGHLVLQESFEVSLLIEVIAIDQKTGLHNFWELIGDGESSDWHYRGNSLDVLADVENINLNAQDTPLFGSRLRCSGCHTGGGLVMKERFPYNDWRNDEPLPTGKWVNSPFVSQTARQSEPASHLDAVVKESLKRYVATLEERSPESEKQWFRSVLATLEMNLVSDTMPYEQRLLSQSAVEIPSTFFVDQRLSGPAEAVRVPVQVYQQALQDLGSAFARDETPGLEETQHAFLVPTVSNFDLLRTESLVARGLLSRELLSDLLAVDFTTPIYSQERFALMGLLPESWETSAELQEHLTRALKSEPKALLYDYLTKADYDSAYHRRRALQYLGICREHSSDVEVVKEWIRLAAQRRVEIQAAQTSQNPRGSILEGGLGGDGFRRIFPSYSSLRPVPYRWRLDSETGRLAKGNESSHSLFLCLIQATSDEF
jgi:hypothetical protein